MIYGVGTDLTDHQRIAAVWQRHGERFARRLLSAVEFAEFLSHPQPVAFLAKRWAAKEAIGKATGLGVRAPFFCCRPCRFNAITLASLLWCLPLQRRSG